MAKCLHPMYLASVESKVPCGWCVNCRQNKRQSWVYRLQAEAKEYPLSLFVTLTYDDEHLPIVRIGSDLFQTNVAVVSKRDVQLFMKRLRKKYEDYKMRYFVTSEYGAKNGRPHYHMILFGFPFTGKMAGDLLAECWQNGFVQAHSLTIKEIAYVCKYMYEKSMCPEILRDEKKYKPFMLCSRNPGIGFGFMKADIIEFYRRHPRDYVRAWAGHKMAMPRYYADKLYDDDMKAFLKEMREEFFRHKMFNEWIDYCARENPILTDLMQLEQREEYEKRMNERLRCKM